LLECVHILLYIFNVGGVLALVLLKKPQQAVNPQLRDYVLYAVKQGQSPDKIKSDLISQGWDQKEIEQAMKQG